MEDVTFPNWSAYREKILSFSRLKPEKQKLWWFRGHASIHQKLQPTVDRIFTFDANNLPESKINQLLDEFKREALLVVGSAAFPDGTALELLARHHGLPSPFLDWTLSPWIASYFAFIQPKDTDEARAIFALNRGRLPANLLDPVGKKNADLELIDDVAQLRFNRRAMQQRGVFLRVSTNTRSLEPLMGNALQRFILPNSARDEALADLDQM